MIPRCGDGIVGPGEVCDDRNRTSGDGCNGSCTSDERCGNGIVELDETCDCGDDALPSPASCNGTHNGGALCSATCKLQRCGDGVIGPGEVCDDGNIASGDGCSASCVSNETCGNAVIDFAVGEQCDDSNLIDADGCQHDCRLPRCGDHIVDQANGEVCDDGNLTPGDGCDGTCRSNETCGNGTVDFFANELCDDRNSRNGDGCSARCGLEPLDWTRDIETAPSAGLVAYAYDAARGRMVVFGGDTDPTTSNGIVAETWEHDGVRWEQRHPTTAPAPRSASTMVYDANRHRIVLFGGQNVFGQPLDDTWEYDGVTWTQRVLPASPTPRFEHAMVYDAGRQKVVVFGGYVTSGTGIDTWEYDGTSWTQKAISSGPALHLGALAYDAARGRVVWFGGAGADNVPVNETWEYDVPNDKWIKLNLNTAPPARVLASLTYDAVAHRLIMFGGDGQGTPSETWGFDGSTWTQLSSTGPNARLSSAMVYAPDRQTSILFGGFDGTRFLTDTWTFAGSAWNAMPTPTAPPTRSAASMVYDSIRGRVVLFGGKAGSTYLTDTWERDRSGWHAIATLASPTPRIAHAAMGYDPSRRRVVLFGGQDSSGTYLGDTWEYDGSTWSQATPIASPSPRLAAMMAYDTDRQRLVLVGGAGASSPVAETWVYDGQTWTKDMPTSSPPVNFGGALTYDPRRHVMVLFGGLSVTAQNMSVFLPDTWEYDGTTWKQVTTQQHPPARLLANMVFDPNRGRSILFGGGVANANQLTIFDDSWEYDGLAWKELAPPTHPGPHWETAAAFDAVRDEVVVFGGDTPTSNVGSTDAWNLAYRHTVEGEACTAGVDYDGDGAAACDDDECWALCTPRCPPTAPTSACSVSPTCGNGICDPLESCRSCVVDCPLGTAACPASCGDFLCDAPGETSLSCPGDCPP